MCFRSTASMNDEQIKGAIRQAFIAVEKGFFQSLDDALAEKWELQLQMPEVLLVTFLFLLATNFAIKGS